MDVSELKKIDGNKVILDPPRGGLTKNLIKALLISNLDRIVYVSCSYKTQYRDYIFLRKKYEIEKIILVDQFPHTNHIESILILKRRWA